MGEMSRRVRRRADVDWGGRKTGEGGRTGVRWANGGKEGADMD